MAPCCHSSEGFNLLFKKWKSTTISRCCVWVCHCISVNRAANFDFYYLGLLTLVDLLPFLLPVLTHFSSSWHQVVDIRALEKFPCALPVIITKTVQWTFFPSRQVMLGVNPTWHECGSSQWQTFKLTASQANFVCVVQAPIWPGSSAQTSKVTRLDMHCAF